METLQQSSKEINHKLSELKVYVTKDYSIFKKLPLNRPVNETHLEHIVKNFREKYYHSIIVVNEKMQVIDGQHRIEGSKQLGIPVYYIIEDGDIQDVHRLNKVVRKWQSGDFLAGYIDAGMPEYIEYQKFVNTFKFKQNEAVLILSGDTKNEAFRAGRFKIRSLSEAYAFAKNIYKIEPYYKGFMRRSFIYAVYSLTRDTHFSINTFIQKLQYQSTSLVDCTTVERYIDLIKKIYNHRNDHKI